MCNKKFCVARCIIVITQKMINFYAAKELGGASEEKGLNLGSTLYF